MKPKVSQISKLRVLNYLLNNSNSERYPVMLGYDQINVARRRFAKLRFDAAVESLESDGLLKVTRYADNGYSVRLLGGSFDLFSKRRAGVLIALFGYALGIATPFIPSLITAGIGFVRSLFP